MKKIALINDISGFGRCSLTAAIPVVSVMGIQACPLPTAILTAQTGFDHYYCDDFTDRMDRFTDQWKQMEEKFDGIYSGYLEGAQQIEKVLRFLDEFQTEDNIYLADPVMGDNGKPYTMHSRELVQGMKQLMKRADALTPNLTELCMLADIEYGDMISHRSEKNYVNQIETVVRNLINESKRAKYIVVTGIIREINGEEHIGNLAVSKQDSFYIENPYTGMGFSGTGDLFASVISASLVKGLSIRKAMEKATYFLQEAIEEASQEKIPAVHGVYFEKYLSRLL
nr:pyridoxamine kinase [Lachnospiraceae bacterium]